ncbi:MAG: FadR family transcriptional regulator [Chloroflexi bacterium]|nr:FadR family transcriptional regulator [Chloroflexota bacterium]
MYKGIQTERLYERIVDQIEQRILAGELKVGDRLPTERDLAEQFHVSRTAVREAVKALCEKGLVESHPGRGTFITDNTSQAMRHSLGLAARVGTEEGLACLEEVREILEPEIAALAASRVTDDQIAAMRDAVTVMDAALEDIERFVEADLDFHLALAEATRNPFIPVLMDSVIDLLREQRKRIFRRGGTRHGQFHHNRILEAIVNRDAEGAREAMRAHLRQVREDGEGKGSRHDSRDEG